MRTIILITAAFLFCFNPLVVAGESGASPAVGDLVEDVGTFIDVGNGLRLQLTLVDKQIVGLFVDAKNQVVESPAGSILFVVDDTTHRDDKWRALLTPTDKVKLTNPHRLYGPPDFRAMIIVRYTDKDASTFPKTPLELERNM